MFFSKLHFFNRYFIETSLFYLIELFGHLVVGYALLDDLGQLVDLRKILQVIFYLERELLNFLLDQFVDFSVNFMHL